MIAAKGIAVKKTVFHERTGDSSTNFKNVSTTKVPRQIKKYFSILGEGAVFLQYPCRTREYRDSSLQTRANNELHNLPRRDAQQGVGIYVNRTSRGHCDHRHSGGDPAPGPEQIQGSCSQR